MKYYKQFLDQHGDSPQLRADIADVYYHLAYIHSAQGARQEAIRLFRDSLPLWNRLVDEQPDSSHPRYFLVKSLHHLGLLSHQEGRLEEAQQYYSQAVDLGKTLVRQHPEQPSFQVELAGVLHNVACVSFSREQYEEAHSLLQQAEEISARVLAWDTTQTDARIQLARTHAKIGQVFRRLDRFDEAVAHYHRAKELYDESVGRGEHMPYAALSAATTLRRLGVVHVQQERFDEAFSFYYDAHQRLSVLARKHPSMVDLQDAIADICRRMAIAYEKRGDDYQANQWYGRAESAQEELVAMDSGYQARRNLARLYRRMGRFHLRAERYGEALVCLDRSAEICADVGYRCDRLRRCAWRLVSLYSQLAENLGQQGRPGEALQRLTQARAIAGDLYVLEEASEKYRETMADLGRVHSSIAAIR